MPPSKRRKGAKGSIKTGTNGDPERNTQTRKGKNQATAAKRSSRQAKSKAGGGGGGSSGLSATDQANALKAVAKLKRQQAALVRDQKAELDRITKCLKHEASVMKAAAPTAIDKIMKHAPPKHKSASKDTPAFVVGDLVDVKQDLSPYKMCFGGIGTVTAVVGKEENMLVDVDLATGGKAKNVPPSRLGIHLTHRSTSLVARLYASPRHMILVTHSVSRTLL